jgi:cytochrome c-type biogenesis protein CcmH/NrfG
MMHAHNGHGFARLLEGDGDGAIVRFTEALTIFPEEARALLGLAAAYDRMGVEGERDSALLRAMRAIDELVLAGRTDEAAMATAFGHMVHRRPMQAIETLDAMINTMPGPTGWTIPIEPFFVPLRGEPSFQGIVSRLAARAR